MPCSVVPPPSIRPRQTSTQRGFTLVEVLVSIVILSIGVLGAVGMQAAALRSNKEVRYQAIAGSMGRELAEKMRGNHTVGVQTTATANPYLLNTTLADTSSISVPSPNCFTSTCVTGLQVAAWDVYEWQTRMITALPSARIVICMDEQPFTAGGDPKWGCTDTGNVAVLKLSWNRANARGATDFTSGTTPSLPLLVLPLTAGSSE